jgi:glycosyltransferase involved in cell wall biosynthesis
VYCYPSVAELGESFGVAPLEAMGVGCPVVVSALDCFSDFIEHSRNGMVFDHRTSDATRELSRTIRLLITDANLAKNIGRAAAKTAQGFSIRSVAMRYIAVFDSALKERAGCEL